MIPINRRTFIMAAAVAVTPTLTHGQTPNSKRMETGILVKADQDRFVRRKSVLGGFPIDLKVATQDTDGGLFIIENLNDKKGGPPRHLHYEQEEWFYAIEGEYLLEIGEERFDLSPGDSILAPRKVPHAWAFKGKGHGRLLIAFQPAGLMESFFQELAKIKGDPEKTELKRLFNAHGMEITGPPLFKQG
jgi:mannose-6-phosphate isomerase-like protein (cupin superfamily)